MGLKNYIEDHRQIDLKNPAHQAGLREMLDGYIEEAQTACRNANIYNIYDRAVLYYEGYQSPVGFTNNYLQEFVAANQSKLNTANILQKDKRGQYFVIDNKLPKMFDSIIGEYTSVKQTMQVMKDDYPRNNNIEKAIQKLFDKVEIDYDVWQNIIIPSIEMSSMFGLSWIKPYYNPNRNRSKGGWIDFKTLSPKEVLFDPTSKQKYFRDSRYRIHRNTMLLDEAMDFVKGFGINPDLVRADAPEEMSYLDAQRMNAAREGRCQLSNIYCAEYVITYKVMNKKTMRMESTGEYLPEKENEEEKDFYFYALYNQSQDIGCFHHAINKNSYSNQDYDKFYLTPMVNKHSRARVFPRGDIEDLANMQDIINITKTLVLNNARQRNFVRILISGKMYDAFGKKRPDGFSLLDDWMDSGGWLPVDDIDDVRKAVMQYKPEELPKEVYEFLQIAEASFKEQSDTQSALMGEYPEVGPLNASAIKLLDQQKRRKLTFKDVNINHCMVNVAKKLYNIFANEYTDEMILRMMGARQGDPQAYLINGIMSAAEFEQHLGDVGLVDKPTQIALSMIPKTDRQFLEKRMQLLEPAYNKYSEENEFEVIARNPEDPSMGAVQSSYTDWLKAVVFVNMLSKNEEMQITITLNFDAQRDAQEQKVMGWEMRKQGDLSRTDFYKLLGPPFEDNAQQYQENIEKENQIEQVGNEVVSRGPEFMQAVALLAQQYDMRQASQNMGQSKPGQNKPPEKESQKKLPSKSKEAV